MGLQRVEREWATFTFYFHSGDWIQREETQSRWGTGSTGGLAPQFPGAPRCVTGCAESAAVMPGEFTPTWGFTHMCICMCIYNMCVCVHVCSVVSWLFATRWTIAHQAPLSMVFPGKNTGVGCQALFQGIFSIPGSNPRLSRLLYWQGSLLLGPPFAAISSTSSWWYLANGSLF